MSNERTSAGNKQSKKQDKTIAWKALEYEYVEKSADWYWIVGTIGALVTAISYFIGNWSFAILVVISTIMFMFLATRRPGWITVKLNHKTISINNRNKYLKHYDEFNIDEERNKLLLHHTQSYKPALIIPLPPDAPTDKIITLLEDELDMEQNEELLEPYLEVILHRLGF